MSEYIVSCEGEWWHFFYKSGYGLCFRKKGSAHFGDFEILLKDVQNDFCAISSGNAIFVVCQDTSGSILYLNYYENRWEKLTLLASKTAIPYPKYFKMVLAGGFVNLYYIINHQEKHMLVHQILNGVQKEPTVVDYISMSTQPFSVCSHSSKDISICYANGQEQCGIRTFRWSQKSHTPFVRLPLKTSVFSPCIKVKDDDTFFISAITKLDKFYNLIFMIREPDGTFLKETIIYLDCNKNTVPIIFEEKDKLVLEWIENGNVMMSYSEDEGQKWKKPTKYMKGNTTSVSVFNIFSDNKYFSCCGFSDGGMLHLYCDNSPLGFAPKEKNKSTFRPKGHEVAEFARSFGYKGYQDSLPEPEYVLKEELYREIATIREILAKHDDAICSILEPKEKEKVPIAENEDDIDKIVMKNEQNLKYNSKQAMSTAKIVVTGQ